MFFFVFFKQNNACQVDDDADRDIDHDGGACSDAAGDQAKLVVLIRLWMMLLKMVMRLMYQHHHSHDRQQMVSFIP